jgi:hypothetical protein
MSPRPRLGRRLRAIAAAAGFALAGLSFGIAVVEAASGTVAEARATSQTVAREYLVKAGFLYNFAKLTQWPGAGDEETGEFRLCVLGADPFGASLDLVRGKTIGARTVTTRIVQDAAGARDCQLVFISGAERARLREHLDALRGHPVLTVSDLPQFSRAGGIISLKTVDNKVRFEINLGAAERVGLRLSSRLLSLAEIVADQSRVQVE